MKKKLKNKKLVSEFSTEILRKIVEDIVVPSNQNLQLEIDTKIENLAMIVSRNFNKLEEKLSSNDQRLILTREEILRKLDGTNMRIDDLAMNRVKYENHLILAKRVDVLEEKVQRKVRK